MIKMIAGVFGLRVKQPNGGSRIVGMGPDDGPFSVAPEREAELVAQGIARYVEPPKVEEQPATGNTEGETEIPKYSVEMKATELRAIGAQFGLTFKVGMTKDAMVAALDAHFATGNTEAEAEAETDTENETDTEDEDGTEDAPTFDPSQAVL